MTLFFFILGLIECAFIRLLGNVARRMEQFADRQVKEALQENIAWPPCAMIIPVAGHHPAMEESLRSLCSQDYPDYAVIIVTAEDERDAIPLVEKLRNGYPGLIHVQAPQTRQCAQKNANLLAGMGAAPEQTEIFAFCDSTHQAKPDFLRCLTLPLARHDTLFSTGYHKVLPQDKSPVSLAYALTVCFMRLLQGIPAFTQPWGGAMGQAREAFARFNIKELWQCSIVDDCSLAGLLQKNGLHPVFCPGALLVTRVKNHAFSTWQAWLERQILFLKFCIRGQWLALGAFSMAMLLPALWAAVSILGGLANFGSASATFLALGWFFILAWSILSWAPALPPDIPFWRWIPAWFLALVMFASVYIISIFKKTMLWHGITYLVEPGGKVKSILDRNPD